MDNGKDYIRINEVCSHNQTVTYNRQGEFEDYVELYNFSDEEIDLTGFYITDSHGNSNKYVIKDVVLGAGEYEIFYVNASNGVAVSDGDVLYLSNSQGKILDSVEVPILDIDKVYAINEENGEWEMNKSPTPAMSNLNSQIEEKVVIEDENVIPIFSKANGFYEEEFMLEITSPQGWDIFYTLDGSTPTEDSIRYKGPILIEDVSYKENIYSSIENISVEEVYVPNFMVDKCNVIRAIAISNETGVYSKEAYASYFIGYEKRYGYEDIYVVSLITDKENLFSEDKGIYVVGNVGAWNWTEDGTDITNYSCEGKGWRRDAHIQLFDTNRKERYSQDIDISIHGGWSVVFNQKSFNLLGKDRIDGEKSYVLPGMFGDKSTSLMLRAGGYRDLFSTKFRDKLNHDLVEDRNITVLKAIPCQVFLNGEFWGTYNLQERIDKGLIENKYGVKEEDVVVIKNTNVVGGDEEDYQLYSNVVKYARNHDLSDPIFYSEIEKMIDIQSYIDYYCFQIYVANCDSVANNYSCWRTKNIKDEAYYDGKWRWILYDTDDSLGMVDGLACHYTDSFNEGHWTTNPMQDDLFKALLKNEKYKRQFVETFLEMAEINFDCNYTNEIVNSYCEEYMQATVLSHRRFLNEQYTEELYLEEVEDIRKFFYKRKEDIVEYMVKNFKIEDLEKYLEN